MERALVIAVNKTLRCSRKGLRQAPPPPPHLFFTCFGENFSPPYSQADSFPPPVFLSEIWRNHPEAAGLPGSCTFKVMLFAPHRCFSCLASDVFLQICS